MRIPSPITRGAPLVAAMAIVALADRLGDHGLVGLSAAVVLVFGGIAAAGWVGKK